MKVTAEPILFVDDNSPDGTSTEIQRLQNHDPGIHLLVRAGKGGFSSACRDGMKKALDGNSTSYVILMDADLSHPPESLPLMIDLLKTNNVVRSARGTWKAEEREAGTSAGTFLSFGANLYARLLTGVPAHDTLTAGFVELRKRRHFAKGRFRSDPSQKAMPFRWNSSSLYIDWEQISVKRFPIVFRNGKGEFRSSPPKFWFEGIQRFRSERCVRGSSLFYKLPAALILRSPFEQYRNFIGVNGKPSCRVLQEVRQRVAWL